MSTHAKITATRSVRPGDAETSCDHCRYFTGHTSWCPVTKTAARTVTLRTHAGAYRRNQIPANTHVLTNELPGVAVGTACGRVFGFARTAGLTVDAEPRPITCSACRSAS